MESSQSVDVHVRMRERFGYVSSIARGLHYFAIFAESALRHAVLRELYCMVL